MVPNHSGGAGNQLHPPPIPARKNITGAQPSPQASPVPQTRGISQPDNSRMETQSAPSSPTQEPAAEPPQAGGVAPAATNLHTGPTGRPKSVAMSDDKIQYTTVSFADDTHAPPPTRRNTTYTHIQHFPAATKTSPDMGEGRSPSPSYVGVGVCTGRPQITEAAAAQNAEESLYDVPPPPVPVRFASQDTQHENPITSPSTTGTTPAEPTTTTITTTTTVSVSEDPFASTQYGDPFMASAWSDPSAFYDKPRSVLESGNVPQEDGYLEIGSVTTTTAAASAVVAAIAKSADFTGESSYEDTSSFLLDIRARYKNKLAEEALGVGQPHHNASNEVLDNDTTYDVPPNTTYDVPPNMTGGNAVDEDPQVGSYDFPSALTRFPKKEGCVVSSGDDSGKCEEPPLHTIQFPAAAKLPPTSQLSAPESSSTGPTHSEGVVRSESLSRVGRANVPLPPTPVEQGSSRRPNQESTAVHFDPPPLPARQGGVPMKQASRGDGPLPPAPSVDRPRLPPMNHPWGNRRQVMASAAATPPVAEVHNPPLPPRKKGVPPGSNGHSSLPEGCVAAASSAPPQQDDPAMLDLMSKGYQRADIESALRIARNDYELARSILKEFGGRH